MTKITAADVRAALRKRYAHPECAIVFEVAQATGFAARRHLDAIAMELWPSRGLALHGIEIKVSRSDWAREKVNPAKAEEIARFCDFFWIAAPTDVVPVAELPTAWGLIEVNDKGATTNRKQPERTAAQSIDRPFMAAMLRAAFRPIPAEEADAVLAQRSKELEESFQRRVEETASFRKGRDHDDAERYRKLAAEFSENEWFFNDAEMKAAAKMVMASGVASTHSGLRSLHATLTKMAQQIGEACGEIHAEPPSDTAKRGRRALA